MVETYPTSMTVDEFYKYRFPEGKVELVRGVPRVREPASGKHGWVQSNLSRRIFRHLDAHPVGMFFNDGVGYELLALPRTVRNPDGAFIRADRLPAGGLPFGFVKLAPDLAIEVLSPDESALELEEKLEDYRLAGTAVVWVIDPARRTVMVMSADAPVRWLRGDEILDAGDVIPGFSCRVSELFEGLSK